MPILRLDAGYDGLNLTGTTRSPLEAARSAAVDGTGPVIVMIHGFKYDPGTPARSPHRTIFADSSDTTALRGHKSWLPGLGFDDDRRNHGLAIAFGWNARGTLWRAQASARSAGQHLGGIVRMIQEAAPQRPVHFVAHSLGSEVAFEALHALPRASIGRVFTIAAASYVSRATAALDSAAGRTAELFNIVSRENDLFDFLFERAIAPPEPGDRALGAGLDRPNAVTLELDCPRSLLALQQFGARIAAPQRRVCHWSGYTRAGALAFFARALRRPETVPLAALRAALPKDRSRRWSRLVGTAGIRDVLPSRRAGRIMTP